MRDTANRREALVDFDPAEKCSAVISPDGFHIAWSTCGPGREPITVNAFNTDLSVRVPEVACEDCGRALDWSPKRDSIVFADHANPARIGILNLSSKTRDVVSLANRNLDKARFSPDGKWVALQAAQTSGDRAQIFAVPLNGDKLAPPSDWVPITNGNYWDDTPVWSERGDALLFYARRDGFGCIWRQSVNPITKLPEGSPTEVIAFHSSRLSLKELQARSQSLALANHEILYNGLELAGSIWMLDYGSAGVVRR